MWTGNDHNSCRDETTGRSPIHAVNGSNTDGGLYSFHSGVNSVFCDGSVRFIKEEANDEIVFAVLTTVPISSTSMTVSTMLMWLRISACSGVSPPPFPPS